MPGIMRSPSHRRNLPDCCLYQRFLLWYYTIDFQEMMQDRFKRKSESSHKAMEMMLLADQYVIGVYGEETVEHLLLTAHIVSTHWVTWYQRSRGLMGSRGTSLFLYYFSQTRSLFLDHSIGPIKINLFVVGIVLKKDGVSIYVCQ